MTLDHTKPYDTLSEAELLEYDQLLAEIAGVKRELYTILDTNWLGESIWQPRQNRDQMALVWHSLPDDVRWSIYIALMTDSRTGWDLVLVKPGVIAAALYPTADDVAGIVEGERIG